MKKGTHHSEETKKKIRERRLGKRLSESHRLKVVKTLNHGQGSENNSWNGGRSITGEGYVLVRAPHHPNAYPNGYYKEHRLILEQHLGRYLGEDEIVHHINGDKQDNRLENLELTTQSEHSAHHWCTPEARVKQSEFMKKVRKEKFWSTKKINVV